MQAQLLLSLLLLLLPATLTASPAVPESKTEAVDEVTKELDTLMKIQKEMESVELCNDLLPVAGQKQPGRKISLVNFTESFIIEHYCCSTRHHLTSSAASISCSYKYKSGYYFLCTVSAIALTVLALLAIVGVANRCCRRPWNLFGDLNFRPLVNRSSLSIRSDALTTPARRIADTSVDSAVTDCQQPKLHQASVHQINDDQLLPDIF